MGGLRDVPRDGLAFAVEVGGQVDGIGPLGCALDLGDLLAPVVGYDVLGLEVMVDVDAELRPCRGFGRSRTWPYEARTR